MIEEQGRVIALDQSEAWILAIHESSCESCGLRTGCGQKLLNNISKGRANRVKVSDTLGVRVGDTVLIGVDESVLMRVSILVYLTPLLTMILSAFVAQKLLFMSEGGVIVIGFLGLALGFVHVWRKSRQLTCNSDYNPQLIRKLP